MADREMTFCTILVDRQERIMKEGRGCAPGTDYLRNAKVYPQSRPSMKKGRPSSRHLRQQNEAHKSMRSMRDMPI